MSDELETNLDEMEGLEFEAEFDEDLDEPYKEATHLYIPPKAAEHFAEQGYELRWVTIYSSPDRGALDVKNINKKEQSGYQFVKREEIPGLSGALTSFFGEKLTAGDHGLYVIGEMALAKISFARVDARRRHLEDKTKARNKAIIEDLRKNNVLPNAVQGGEFKTTRTHMNPASTRKASLGRAAKAKATSNNDSE